MISVLSVVHDTMVDGPGFRTSIYCAGCPNHCPECHNPQSWDINHGTMTSTEELMKEIMDDPFANVTFSGGDPMFQAEGFAELARAIRQQSDKTIWCFTGFLFENLVKNPAQLELLKLIDVLVDGPYQKDKRDTDLFFRGSSNQRIINVKKSLQEGKVVESHKRKSESRALIPKSTRFGFFFYSLIFSASIFHSSSERYDLSSLTSCRI